jgi:hypothetical protein
MPTLDQNLILSRCPHCNVDSPNLFTVSRHETRDHAANNLRRWSVYVCGRCGGTVIAAAHNYGQSVLEVHPSSQQIEEDLPPKAKTFLEQAVLSINAPAGAVMLSASSVDAMLKAKGYVDGSLYSRIENAACDHLITSEMATWAHDVRLDANDQRHADEDASLPSQADARRAIDFALALGMFMFVLPARVRRGITDATKNPVP